MSRKQERPQELELIAATVHELKTPLTIIHGVSSTLEAETYGSLNSEQLEQVHQIQKAERRLNSLVDSLLHIGNLSYLQLLQPVQLQGTLHQVLEELELLADERKITIAYQAKALSPVLADPISIYQLLYHLLISVIKQARPQSQIDLLASRRGSMTVLTLNIPFEFLRPSEAKRITATIGKQLQPLRGHSNSAGLSLYIVKSIAEFYGGNVKVVVRKQGTIVTVRLPISQQLSLFTPDS